MTSDPSPRADPDFRRLGRAERATLPERIVVLVIVGVFITVDLIGLFLVPGEGELTATLFSIAATAVFALFLWSPLIAVCVLGAVFIGSFFFGSEVQVLNAVAVATGFVLRLARLPLVLVYSAGFIIAVAAVVVVDDPVAAEIAIYLVMAVLAGALGYALRLMLARGRRLEVELAASAEQERQAVLAERRWIAGELHDSIAHHLTIVSLHVQLLDDDETRPASQAAIGAAARKAMTDLRFVIELADDGPRASGAATGDLADAVDEARGEIEAAGHTVLVEGDPGDERIPRSAEIILARIVRESATNILKHAGQGPIEILLVADENAASLRIISPMPVIPRRDLPSSRTGLDRMAERVLGASGEFSAAEDEGRWIVSAVLPIARVLSISDTGQKS